MIEDVQVLLDKEYEEMLIREWNGNFNFEAYLILEEFSTGGDKPAIWLDAAIHAREWVTQATALWISNKIASDYGNDPSITLILDVMDIFLLPVTNPDGSVFSQTQNCIGRRPSPRYLAASVLVLILAGTGMQVLEDLEPAATLVPIHIMDPVPTLKLK